MLISTADVLFSSYNPLTDQRIAPDDQEFRSDIPFFIHSAVSRAKILTKGITLDEIKEIASILHGTLLYQRGFIIQAGKDRLQEKQGLEGVFFGETSVLKKHFDLYELGGPVSVQMPWSSSPFHLIKEGSDKQSLDLQVKCYGVLVFCLAAEIVNSKWPDEKYFSASQQQMESNYARNAEWNKQEFEQVQSQIDPDNPTPYVERKILDTGCNYGICLPFEEYKKSVLSTPDPPNAKSMHSEWEYSEEEIAYLAADALQSVCYGEAIAISLKHHNKKRNAGKASPKKYTRLYKTFVDWAVNQPSNHGYKTTEDAVEIGFKSFLCGRDNRNAAEDKVLLDLIGKSTHKRLKAELEKHCRAESAVYPFPRPRSKQLSSAC